MAMAMRAWGMFLFMWGLRIEFFNCMGRWELLGGEKRSWVVGAESWNIQDSELSGGVGI